MADSHKSREGRPFVPDFDMTVERLFADLRSLFSRRLISLIA